MGQNTGPRHAALTTWLSIGGLAVGGAVLLGAPAAFAAGSGYTPAPPTPGGTVSGLPGSVVAVATVQPSGGTAKATIGSSTTSASIPAGTFSVPTQLVTTDASNSAITPPNGASAVVTFGVGFYQNGTKVTGSFSPPVTVTVSSPSITAGSTVYLVEGTKLVAAPGATVKNGSATFTISSDPTVEIAAPAAATTTAVPGATTVQTGKPFLLEGGVGGLLLVGGGWALYLARRRRRAA